MDTKLTIDILTGIGALLGTIAFFKSFLETPTQHNRKIWDKCRRHYFVNFLSLKQEIEKNPSKVCNYGLDHFVTQIQKKPNLFDFKVIGYNFYWHWLEKIEYKYRLLEKLFKEWCPSDGQWRDPVNYYISIEPKNIKEAINLINKIETLYNKITKRANKYPYEFLLPWKWF